MVDWSASEAASVWPKAQIMKTAARKARMANLQG
jgi:hypothetical protein